MMWTENTAGTGLLSGTGSDVMDASTQLAHFKPWYRLDLSCDDISVSAA
jgi:hypothetical protein